MSNWNDNNQPCSVSRCIEFIYRSECFLTVKPFPIADQILFFPLKYANRLLPSVSTTAPHRAYHAVEIQTLVGTVSLRIKICLIRRWKTNSVRDRRERTTLASMNPTLSLILNLPEAVDVRTTDKPEVSIKLKLQKLQVRASKSLSSGKTNVSPEATFLGAWNRSTRISRTCNTVAWRLVQTPPLHLQRSIKRIHFCLRACSYACGVAVQGHPSCAVTAE